MVEIINVEVAGELVIITLTSKQALDLMGICYRYADNPNEEAPHVKLADALGEAMEDATLKVINNRVG